MKAKHSLFAATLTKSHSKNGKFFSRNDLLVECMKILPKGGSGCFVSDNPINRQMCFGLAEVFFFFKKGKSNLKPESLS